MNAEPVTDGEFAALMTACPGAAGARMLGVGVSGGPDSMALCLLAGRWAETHGVGLVALTVDHGLRPEAAAEASAVGRWLSGRGMTHRILRGDRSRPDAGLQRVARSRRLALLDGWRRDAGADRILLAHSADDQAETFLLRALADSGPDGLAAMNAEVRVGGTPLSRPLLDVARPRLAATCSACGQPWVSDPSNLDTAYTRVRLRALVPGLESAGLHGAQVLRLVRAMAAARRAVDRHCAGFVRTHGTVGRAGYVRFDRGAFCGLPPRFAELLVSRLVRAVGGTGWPPRTGRVARLVRELRSAGAPPARTLGGCLVRCGRDGALEIVREPAACAGPLELAPGRQTRWDNRFEVVLGGSEPALLGTLDARGWNRLARDCRGCPAATEPWRWPREARLSYPVVRHLDGTVSIPHLVEDVGACRRSSSRRVGLAFCPDQDWIRNLAALEEGR